jgi:hypothetical protein
MIVLDDNDGLAGIISLEISLIANPPGILCMRSSDLNGELELARSRFSQDEMKPFLCRSFKPCQSAMSAATITIRLSRSHKPAGR